MTGRVEHIGLATLYLGRCQDILPTLGRVDAVVTDPPYGIGENTSRASRTKSRPSGLRDPGVPRALNWKPILGDSEPFDPAPLLTFRKVVICGANHFASRLPDASKWIVWDKRENTGPDDNADCELVWTNLKGPARIHRQLWRGLICRGEENASPKLHPTQKPIAFMARLLAECRLPEGATVLDPYMGSGTTGVAAARARLSFIGIEAEPSYFDIACKRIEDAQRQGSLFTEAA